MASNQLPPFTRFNAYGGANNMGMNPRRTPYQRPNNNSGYNVRPPNNNYNPRPGNNQAGYENRPYQPNRQFPNNRQNPQRVQSKPQQIQPQPIPQPKPKDPEVQPKVIRFIPTDLRKRINELMALTDERRKQILGELMYPKVLEKTNLKLAPKITGMLLDLETDEVIELIENPASLEERIGEALEVLNDAPAQ
jgi:polyadenylate-binding protein